MRTQLAGIIIFATMCASGSSIVSGAPRLLDGQCATVNPLVGVWRFDSEVDTKADGTVVATATSKDKHGFIVYTADKFVSAIIMPSKRNWELGSATRDDLAASADEGTSYAGRYEINTLTQTVTHILGVSFEPAYEGQHLVRKYIVNGNKLALSGTYFSGGESFQFTLTLLRDFPSASSRPRKFRQLGRTGVFVH
jgi:hypothetical protein